MQEVIYQKNIKGEILLMGDFKVGSTGEDNIFQIGTMVLSNETVKRIVDIWKTEVR